MKKRKEIYIYKKTYHNVWVSNVSACMGGGLANEMESHTSSERVQAGEGHEGRGTRLVAAVAGTC